MLAGDKKILTVKGNLPGRLRLIIGARPHMPFGAFLLRAGLEVGGLSPSLGAVWMGCAHGPCACGHAWR